MMPIVDYARIYALKHGIRATNTLERLQGLHERGVLSLQNYQEMVQAYSYLMQIRLQVQAAAIAAGSSKARQLCHPEKPDLYRAKASQGNFLPDKKFPGKAEL